MDWTTTEEARLREEYPDVHTADLAKDMGRSLSSVQHKARELRLKKTRHYKSKVRRGRFGPGHKVNNGRGRDELGRYA